MDGPSELFIYANELARVSGLMSGQPKGIKLLLISIGVGQEVVPLSV